jgi:hypothetical protein
MLYMSGYLHYLHHVWVDPLSASQQVEAAIFVGLPIVALVVVGGMVWDWFWERYNA